MHARSTVDTWLSQLNPNDPSLVLDPYGQCQLVRNPNEMCTLFVPADTSEAVVLYSHIWQLSGEFKADQYEALLGLNMLGIKTLGCTLGLDAQFRSLVLSYALPFKGCDLDGFCTAVDNFFSAARQVQEQIDVALKPRAPHAPQVPSGRSGNALQRPRFLEKADRP
jgi:hypothetical protein